MKRRREDDHPRTKLAREWVKPSREQQLADGGYFDESGWWVTIRRSKAEANSARTPEQRREIMRKVNAALTPEQRRDRARKASAAFKPEQRREHMLKLNAALTPEQRQENARKGGTTSRGRKQARNTSGHVGVSWERAARKWCSTIWVDGKNIRLGYFTDINDAIAARKAAEEKYWKDGKNG